MEVWLDVVEAGRSSLPTSWAASLFDRIIVPLGTSAPSPFDFEDPSKSLRLEAASGHLRARGGGGVVGLAVAVTDLASQARAVAALGSVDWVVVDARRGQPCIVAETILGAAERTGTRVAAVLDRPSDAQGLAFALERGVDAVVLRAPDPSRLQGGGGGDDADADARALFEAVAVAKSLRGECVRRGPGGDEPKRRRPAAAAAAAAAAARGSPGGALLLTEAVVVAVVDGGVADRVAVDLTTLLSETEGCLVGSSAKALALVLGETVESSFVPPRPFRCNAGPVHSYLAMADGSTKYLAEVRAGDAVLVADASTGATRAAVVGRAKIEPRPTLRVDFRRKAAATPTAGRPSDDDLPPNNLFLQHAETVRLAHPTGGLPVTEASARHDSLEMTILVKYADQGTHVGRRISVQVDER